MTLSILTNSAAISLPPVFWFTRSTNAGGKLCSWPKRIPIFFIRDEPQITRLQSPRRPTAWQARIYTDKNKRESLKSLRMPVRFGEAAFAFIFEKFVNGREDDAGAFGADADVEIEFVVEKINVAAAEHVEKFPGDIEVLGVNYPV